jgi:hypothetical protein
MKEDPDRHLHPGVSVMLSDGKEYVVPPLDLDQYTSILPDLPALAATGGEWLAPSIKIVVLALSRNYPGLTEASVRRLLDLRSLVEALSAALRTGGLPSPTTASPPGPPSYQIH